LNVFMKNSNHINALFVTGALVDNHIWKDMFSPFTTINLQNEFCPNFYPYILTTSKLSMVFKFWIVSEILGSWSQIIPPSYQPLVTQ
jgi:hypothetical protein